MLFLKIYDDRESEQELMDQVYRRLVMLLCRPCYESWIEDPTQTLAS